MSLQLFQEYQNYIVDVQHNMLETISAQRTTSAHHLFDEIHNYLQRPAKYLRPLTIMLICDRLGGDIQKAIICGAAVEIYHNATLIYDDIQDNAEVRRHQPTMHISNSLSLAMSIGAVTRSLMYHPIHKHQEFDAHEVLYIHEVLDRACTAISVGQGVEVLWRYQGRWNVREEEYYEMISGKTGALFAACCQLGAFLGDSVPSLTESFYQFGMKFGTLFQLVNDYLDLIKGETGVGRPAYEDLREAKNTLFIIRALQKLSHEGDSATAGQIEEMLNQGLLGDAQIDICLRILNKTESIQSVRTEIEEQFTRLREEVRNLNVPRSLANDLVSMIDLLVGYLS